MKCKRLSALFLALALLLGVSAPALPALGLATAAAAAPVRTEADQYFGSQLTAGKTLGAESRAFYDALVEMYEKKVFESGEDQQVSLNGDQVQAYLSGQSNLGHALTNARDAFYMDYPDLFYVNFNNFALRVVDSTVYITPGSRGTGYLLDGIEPGAVPGLAANYDAKLAQITAAGTEAKPTAAEGSQQAAAVRAVHDKLAGMLTYKLDNACKPENQKFIRTAYGIVTGEGVCEAYSRAFKSAMDELGIPCVLVEGAFRHSADRVEAHMWALVQVEGAWYGVDVTMDDPEKDIVDAYGEKTGKVAYDDYLLAGDVTMSAQHSASDTMSAASYKFTYPELTQNDYGVVTMHNSGGLMVRLDESDDGLSHEAGGGSGTFYVSYNGMSYTRAAEEGYYILARFMSVNTDAHFDGSGTTIPGDGQWSENTDWSYLCPKLYPLIEALETEKETPLPMPHVRYVQFAVTDQAPGDYTSATTVDAIYNATHYQGDPSLLLAKTDVLFNPGGDYVAPPYIERAWPTQQSTMLIGQTYQIEAKMDDKLIPAEEGAQLGYTLKAYAFYKGERKEYPSAEGFCTVSKPSLKENDDGTSSITFEFTPSEQWAHDTIFYEFSFTGVVGAKSGKKPNNLVYLASHPCTAYAYQSQGFDWNLYGKPQLMDDFENSDISIENWQTKDGTKLPNDLKHRMTLVVSNATPNQKTDMEAMAQSKAGQKPAASETYSINLTVCKKQVVSTGQAVRVMLGFPEGYGPDDAGVTFKAYHYSVDAIGNITGVNEIPCIVTPQGLLVLCDSFSPFSVCAFKGLEETDPGAAKTGKSIVVSANCGGGTVKVTGVRSIMAGAEENIQVSNVYTLDEGGIATIDIKAPDGQCIRSVTVAGKSQTVPENSETMTVKLSYDELQGLATGIVDVEYAPAAYIEKHKNDETPKLPALTVRIPESANAAEGDEITIEATVLVDGKEPPKDGSYTFTYEWFKDDGTEAVGTGNPLTIAAASETDNGNYKVKVTMGTAAASGTERVTAESGSCTVKVTPAGTVTPLPSPTPTAKPTPAPTPAPTKAPAPPVDDHPEIADAIANGTWGQPDPTPAPAAPAAPTAPAAPAPTARPSTGKTGGTVMPPSTPNPAPTPTPVPGTPPPALTNTPVPDATQPPAATPAPETAPAPEATVAPTATPAPEPAKGGIPPLAIAGLVTAGVAAAGGVAWMFLPRRKHR